MDGCRRGCRVFGSDSGVDGMIVILWAWLATIAVIAVGIGVVHAVFRLMGPDYDDKIY